MKIKGPIYVAIILVISCALIGLLIVLNIKRDPEIIVNTTTQETTTKKINNYIYDRLYTMYIDSTEVEIPLKLYNGTNYKIEYDVEVFNIVNVSNGDIFIRDKNDEDNYLHISTISEEEYNNGLEEASTEIYASHKVSEMYFKGEKSYLKLVSSINIDDKIYNNIQSRITLMVSTLEVY